MIEAIIFDFSRVFLFPKNENYFGELNALYDVLSENPTFNFNDHFEFNQELMNFLKEEGICVRNNLYLFTSGHIQNTRECQRFLNGTFRNIFSSGKMNLPKSKPSSYKTLAEKIDVDPGNILYIDDNRQNTQAAEIAGMQTITFRNNMQFETEFEGYLKC